MEALIFFLDVGCVVYLCWRVYKSDPVRPRSEELGYFRYRENEDMTLPAVSPKDAESRRA